MTGPLGTFALPVDGPGAGAALVGLVMLVGAGHPVVVARFRLVDERRLLWLLAAVAGLLSLGYVVFYLRGGPRIIDATSYFLQARALSEGHLAFDVPEPSGSFRGRFLIQNPETGALSVIFPPGYAAVLAMGFALGAPLAVGPVLAVVLVFATHALARRLFANRDVALLAAALSVTSATLRYHTADTMSHGLSALLFSVAVLAALARHPRVFFAGLCVGWLVATRPVTGFVALGMVVGLLGPSRFVLFGAGLLPGLGLLVAHQFAATGEALRSTQLAYYALADGPPGCFRYGFGEGVGCLHEHGQFVAANLPDGYGARAAVGTTLRRLRMHLLDVANFEPWALLLVAGAVVGRYTRGVRLLALPVLGVVIAYAPFYFDGNYPGGGARFFADALPFEHVLLAWTLHRFRIPRFGLPLALLGFSLHASHEHVALANREGGRPMYEPHIVADHGVRRGLVFVDTDHGFSLGHDPAAHPSSAVVVARRRGDAHDVLLWDALGRPEAFSYEYDLWGHPARPRVEPFGFEHTDRWEGEAEWPPRTLSGGWVRLDYAPCASGGRALGLVPVEGRRMRVGVEVAVRRSGPHEIALGFLSTRAGWAVRASLGEARWEQSGDRPGCSWTPAVKVDLSAGVHELQLDIEGTGAALDVVRLHTADGPDAPSVRKGVDI